MGFYPHVHKGDAVKPSAALENDLRDLVNSVGGIGARGLRGCADNATHVQVWNAGDVALPSGAAVSILILPGSNEYRVIDDALPCTAFTGDCRLFGVLSEELAIGAIGDCIVSGVVKVPVAGEAYPGARVLPVISDGDRDLMPKFGVVPGAGGARVLGVVGVAEAIVELGFYDNYFGHFKVALTHMTGVEGEYDDTFSSYSESSESSAGSSESGSSGSSESGSESGSGEESSGGGSGGGSGSSGSGSLPGEWIDLGWITIGCNCSGAYTWTYPDRPAESYPIEGGWAEGHVRARVLDGTIQEVRIDDLTGGADMTIPEEATVSDSARLTGWRQKDFVLTIRAAISGSGSADMGGGNGWSARYSGSGTGTIQLGSNLPGENEWWPSGSSSSSSSSGSSGSGGGGGSGGGSSGGDSSGGDSSTSPPEESSSTSHDSGSSSIGGDSESSWESGGSEGEELVLTVYDGAYPASGTCGFVRIGRGGFSYPRTIFKRWRLAGVSYVYITDGKICFGGRLPVRDGKFHRLLARLVCRNGACAVVQEQHGAVFENYHLAEAGDGE